jgi:hypothetical protein
MKPKLLPEHFNTTKRILLFLKMGYYATPINGSRKLFLIPSLWNIAHHKALSIVVVLLVV